MRGRRRLVERMARRLASSAGFELARAGDDSLRRLREHGVRPVTVIDAGAALGDWTRGCAAVFPSSHYLLIEPLSEFEQALARTCQALQSARVVRAAVSSTDGAGIIHVHDDLVGSSLLREAEGPCVDGSPRRVTVTTIDEIVRAEAMHGPFLVKLDVQGSELDAINGAQATLVDTAALVAELSLFSFFAGGAAFQDVTTELARVGLVLYDIHGLRYRPLDGALAQLDALFVREDSPVRRDHRYASPSQRAAQSAEFVAAIGARLRRG